VNEPAPSLGELLLTLRCRACRTPRLAEVTFCPACRSRLAEPLRPGPEATLVSYTTIHRAPKEGLAWALPFSVGLVETDVGSRCLAVLAFEPSDAHIDGPVRLSVRVLDDGVPAVVAGAG
jgi:uncharacterized OB-fold protein